MRYRLTKKGKRAVVLLSFFMLTLLTLAVFGISSLLREPPEDGNSSPPPVTDEMPDLSPLPPSEAASDVPNPTDTPSDTPSPSPASDAPHSSEPPPTGIPVSQTPASSAPPESYDYYARRVEIVFPDGSSAADDVRTLTELLREQLSVSSSQYQAPVLDTHYLIIEGCYTQSGDAALALKRAVYISELLSGELALPRARLVPMSAETPEGAGNLVIVSFIAADSVK